VPRDFVSQVDYDWLVVDTNCWTDKRMTNRDGEGRSRPRRRGATDVLAQRRPASRTPGYGLIGTDYRQVPPRDQVTSSGLECSIAGVATALSNNALKLTAPRGRHCRLTEWNQWRPRAHSRTGAAA